MDKMRVAILMGGPSAEHEISLKTGEMVFENLDRRQYQPQKIVISKKGRWPIAIQELKSNFNVVFIAMHGEYGEDGILQKLLEKTGIAYTGSDSRASRLGMDKLKSLARFRKAGLNIPKIFKHNPPPLPAVVKPVDRGSSVGVSIVKKVSQLKPAVQSAKKYSPRIIFEEYIDGRELTCGVLEIKNKAGALPPTEIIPQTSNFFDYEAKYTPGASREITPARLTPLETKNLQKAALAAHKAIGASGYSRSDFILADDGKLYILEINTLPGMTATSLIPKAAQAAGISFSQLLDIIINDAMSRHRMS